jgi:hypothetical protein
MQCPLLLNPLIAVSTFAALETALPTSDANCSVGSRFPFSPSGDERNVLIVLQNVTSRGCIRRLLRDGGDNVKTPYLRASSVAARLLLRLQRSCSCVAHLTTEIKLRILSHDTSQSTVFCLDNGKQCLAVVCTKDCTSSFSWYKPAMEKHRNHLQSLYKHTPFIFCPWSHDVMALTWCLLPALRSQTLHDCTGDFLHAENNSSCNYMFIDSSLQHIEQLTNPDFVQPTRCRKWCCFRQSQTQLA